jgi:thiol-disulfide isomerase/thioredoxin
MIDKIVYFYAEWCGPCNRMSRLSRRVENICQSNNVTFEKYACPKDKNNRDDFYSKMDTYSFSKIPSIVIIFNDGETKMYHDLTELKYFELIKYIEGYFSGDDDDF